MAEQQQAQMEQVMAALQTAVGRIQDLEVLHGAQQQIAATQQQTVAHQQQAQQQVQAAQQHAAQQAQLAIAAATIPAASRVARAVCYPRAPGLRGVLGRCAVGE